MWKLIRLCLVCIVVLTGCAAQQQPTVVDETGAVCPLPLPSIYSAVIPCTDCPLTQVFLTLRPDSLYFLRISTKDKETGVEEVKAEIGVWKYVSSGNTLVLGTYDNVVRTLLIGPAGNLRVVKVSGGIIPPDVNYDLIRDDSNPGYNDVARVRGMYRVTGTTGRFTECLSGADFPVADQEENAGLERAYFNTPHGQGEQLLVTLDARLITRAKPGSIGYEEAVVPVHFIDLQPGIDCSGEKSSRLTLADNTWRLIEINGKPLALSEDQDTPFFHLAAQNNLVRGFGGCNRFSGTYFVKGQYFLFNKRIGTRMACVSGMELEFEFFRVLSATDGYRIEGNILELRNREGKVLAKLEHAGGVQ
jgi:heat shock protein HslJ